MLAVLVRHEYELVSTLRVNPIRLLHQKLGEAVSLQNVPEEKGGLPGPKQDQ